MTTEKMPIIVVGEDKDVLALLSHRYTIEKTYSYAEFEANSRRIKPNFVIIDGNIDSDLFAMPTDGVYVNFNANKNVKQLTNIYSSIRNVSLNYAKFIGFGNGALLLAIFNKAKLLFNISNHMNIIHSTSFIMPDNTVLEFDVKSNHNHLIIPSPRPSFDILAFSTFNNSNSYTQIDGDVFKANRDFLEIESVKFRAGNSYCFMYDVPKPSEVVLCDLTLQLLER